jgi:hypothetical protein
MNIRATLTDHLESRNDAILGLIGAIVLKNQQLALTILQLTVSDKNSRYLSAIDELEKIRNEFSSHPEIQGLFEKLDMHHMQVNEEREEIRHSIVERRRMNFERSRQKLE